MTNCMRCSHAKSFALPDGRIDFSQKLCQEGPPTPTFVGMDPARGPVIQYLWPVVNERVRCDRFEDAGIVLDIGDKPEPGSATQ